MKRLPPRPDLGHLKKQAKALLAAACASDAACSTILVSGQPALVKATYPCDLTVMGVNYAPSCTLKAETAQLVQ